MYQRFNKDLTTQEIYLNGSELATIGGKDRDEQWNKVYSYPESQKELVATLNNPVLVTDHLKVIQDVTDYARQQTVLALIGKQHKITEYGDVIFDFDQQSYPSLWWPNIDTLNLCRWLWGLDLSWVKVGCEVWSGPGFISKFVVDKNPRINQRDMYDIDDGAQKYFDDHFSGKEQYGVMNLTIGDATQSMQGKSYDLITCNPPYIPREWSIEDNPYEWLQLISHLIKQRKNLLNPWGKLVINISSLSNNTLNEIFNEEWIKPENLWFKKVPLKVFNTLNNKERLQNLIENYGLQTINDPGQHKYWHYISTIAIARD